MKKQKIKLTDSESNSSSSNVEELDLCDDSSGNDSSSDESDSDSFLSDDGSDRANVFMRSISEGSNLSVGTSCILITQFSRKYKLPRKYRLLRKCNVQIFIHELQDFTKQMSERSEWVGFPKFSTSE